MVILVLLIGLSCASVAGGWLRDSLAALPSSNDDWVWY